MSIDVDRLRELEGLLQFCTPRQREKIEAYIEHDSQQAAAHALGINQSNIRDAIKAARKRAERKGFSFKHGISKPPMSDYHYKGVSQLVDSEGNVKLQWLKQDRDKDSIRQAMEETTERLCENLPQIPKISPLRRKGFNEDLMCQYTITDYHLGMLAWHEEGGDNWDVKIGKKMLIDVFKYLIEKAPDSEVGMFANIGDFMHYDGWLPVTPHSGHVLDTESRFPKVIDAAVDSIIEVIGMLLQKHKKVIVVNMQGNHDMASSYWLQKLCHIVYKNNPRVEFPQNKDVQVDRLTLPYYAYEFGKTALFYHHGHKRTPKDQVGIYAAQFPKVWGNTEYRYGHTGHKHQTEVIEKNGIKVEMHNTIAAKDAYASHGAWYSERSANVITYHKEFGEVGRDYVKPPMLGY